MVLWCYEKGGNDVEGIISVLLGPLQLFYPLLIASIITFVYALIKRSWFWMLLSGILLYPDAWYFSGYPPFPWVKFIPLVQMVLTIILYLMKRKENDQTLEKRCILPKFKAKQ